MVYYFTSAVALGAPARTVDFTVPTGNFGDIFAGYVAPSAWACRSDWLRIATNVNDILARTLKTGIYEVREVPRHRLALDGHPDVVEFRAAVVRGQPAATPTAVRRLMGSLKQSGRFVLPDATLAAIRDEFDAGRADETETAARDPRRLARGRRPRRSPYRGGAVAVADRDTPDLENPQHRAVDRASGEIPRCGRGRLRRAAATAGLARRT